jgi:hypothetical protein
MALNAAEAIHVQSNRGWSKWSAVHWRHCDVHDVHKSNMKLALLTGCAEFGRVYHELAQFSTLSADEPLGGCRMPDKPTAVTLINHLRYMMCLECTCWPALLALPCKSAAKPWATLIWRDLAELFARGYARSRIFACQNVIQA